MHPALNFAYETNASLLSHAGQKLLHSQGGKLPEGFYDTLISELLSRVLQRLHRSFPGDSLSLWHAGLETPKEVLKPETRLHSYAPRRWFLSLLPESSHVGRPLLPLSILFGALEGDSLSPAFCALTFTHTGWRVGAMLGSGFFLEQRRIRLGSEAHSEFLIATSKEAALPKGALLVSHQSEVLHALEACSGGVDAAWLSHSPLDPWIKLLAKESLSGILESDRGILLGKKGAMTRFFRANPGLFGGV